MRAKSPTLAKLSRPALHRAVPRERLFALLDRHRNERRAICIVGPPGAGKTTLLGSWLDSRKVRGIWYQVDAGDADLSTFFYYLSQAAGPWRRRGQRALPLLLPEYLSDIPGFARRFFREFFARLPAGAVIAFDNYQEVQADEMFHQVVALAVDEAPPGIVLAMVSRRDPPACYARLLANENVALVDWENLRLDPQEAFSIAARHGDTAPDVLRRMHEITDGWAAGLVLALEGGARKVDAANVADSTRDATFNYFAAEIFSRVPPQTQRFLMWTSVLPDVPVSVADRLTGDANSASILDELYRRHLFTHRKPGAEPIYWYHALFRGFLSLQARERLSVRELDEVRSRAALLVEERDPNAAFSLYCDAQNWRAAERLIVANAQLLIGQGRWKVAVESICRLPRNRVESSAWLSCWLGIALTSSDPVLARRHLEHAFALAAERGDATCRVSAAGGVIQTYLLEYNAFRPLDKWVEALLDAIPEARFPSADAEMMAYSSVVAAFGFRQLNRPELDRSALRVFELLPKVSDVNLRLSAAVSILAWGSLTGPIAMAHRAAPIAVSLWRDPDVTPLNAAVAGYLISWYYCFVRKRAECEAALSVLVDIHEQYGLPAAAAYAATIGIILEIYDDRVDAAARWYALLERTSEGARPFDRAMLDGLKGWMCMVRGEEFASLELSLRSVRALDALGSVFHQVAMRQNLIWHHIEFGCFDEAAHCIVDCRRLMAEFGTYRYELDVRVAEATIARRRGDLEGCRQSVRAVFGMAREQALDHAFIEIRRWMSPLCAIALEAGIEPEYVRRLIKHYEWAVPPERPEAWPWPVRVYALGSLRVHIDVGLLTFTRKTPRKPIALLKAILAFGRENVPIARVLDALWPDEEGDKAYHSFGLALHRLRKLLGSNDAVLLDQGRLSLNRVRVWTDLERLDRQLQAVIATGDPQPLLAAYAGHFLVDSDEHAWVLPTRDQYRMRFVRTICDVARQRESAGETHRARVWYQQALEIDPFVEDFVQGLMRCHIALGEQPQAEAAFAQLKSRLQAGSGKAPSSKTMALARSLTLDGGV